MKKMGLYMGSIFALLIILPIKVNAFSGSTNISCNPVKITLNGTTTCSINTNVTSGSINGFSAKILLPSTLQFVSYTKPSGWNGDAEDGSIDIYAEDINKTGNVGLGTFVIKAVSGSSGNVTLSGINISDETFNLVTSNVNTVSIDFSKSSNANLNSLTINNGTLAPSFLSSITNYIATTTSDKITIGGSVEQTKASISGVGEKSLSYGDNKFTITVTAEDGTKKNYFLTVTRNKIAQNDNTNNNTEKETTNDVTKSNVNTLKNLEINNIDIDFKSDILAYSTRVENNVEEIEIKASATDEKAKIDGIGKQQLKVGNNVFKIVVTAESGVTKTYAITVIREDENGKTTGLSDINDLKALKIKGYTFDFDKDKTKYSINVNSTVDEITVVATPQDAKAIIAGDGVIKLNEGKNKVKLIVTAENGDKKAYTITVNRGETTTVSKEDNSMLIPIIIAGIVIGGIITTIVIIEKKKKSNLRKKDDNSLNSVKNNNVSLKDEIKQAPLKEETKEIPNVPINKTSNTNENTVKETEKKEYQEAKKIDVEEEIIDFE